MTKWALSRDAGILQYLQINQCNAAAAKSLQSSDSVRPSGGSPPSSPVPGILQARTLESVAIFLSNA